MSTDTDALISARTEEAGPWGLVLLLAATHAAVFADRFLTALVAAPMAHDLHLSDTQLGLVQGTSFVVSYMIATPLFGRLADRVSSKAAILAGLSIWTAATFAVAFVRGFHDLVAARLLLGVGEAAFTPAALALISARAGPARRGRAIAVLTSGSTLGKGLVLLAGGALLGALARGLGPSATPWRLLFQLAVLPNLAIACALAFVRAPVIAKPLRPSLCDVAGQVAQAAPDYVRLLLAGGAVVLLSQTLAAWIPLFYGRAFHLAPATAGMLAGAAVLVFGPLGGIAGGVALDRFGRGRAGDLPMRLLAAGLALTAVGALVALTTHVPAISLAAYAVVLLALGAAAPASLVQLQAVTPERLRASVTAIYLALVTGIGFGVGPPVVGVMSDRLFGPGRHLPAALLSFVLAACLIGLAGAVAPFRPKPHAA